MLLKYIKNIIILVNYIMNKTKSDIKKFSPFHNLLINISKSHKKMYKIHLASEYLVSRAFERVIDTDNKSEQYIKEMKEDRANFYDKFCLVLYNKWNRDDDDVEYKIIELFIHDDYDTLKGF